MTQTAIEPVASSAGALSGARVNAVFVTILLGILLAALDQTIVSTALPTITADLGGAAHLSWVVTSYLLAQTVSVALAGKFGDLFGRKRIFQLSAGIFVIGSMLCGLATNMAVRSWCSWRSCSSSSGCPSRPCRCGCSGTRCSPWRRR
jgi:MFS family permease